jgi:futalosine hydrolase
MKNLIVIASLLELKKINPYFQNSGYIVREENKGHYVLKKDMQEASILVTGMGIVNTVFALTSYLHAHSDIKAIVNVGIGGAYPNSRLKLGEVVAIYKDNYAEYGEINAKEFKPLKDINLKLNEFQDESPDYNQVEATQKIKLSKIQEATGATVSSLAADSTTVFQRESIWRAQVESMEGAAVIDIANRFKLPVIQIRSISNIVGEKDKKKWDFKQSFENLFRVLNENFNELSSS